MSLLNESANDKIVIQIDADLEELIPGYLRNKQNDIDAIATALLKDDYEAIRIIGHSMKGSGGGYGFDLITELGKAIESAAISKSTKEIGKLQPNCKTTSIQ